MSTVKKPILLDETGKEIVAHMRTQNALLGAIARESIGALTSWKDIQTIVRRGLAPEIFHIGDQFIVPWKVNIQNLGNVEHKNYQVPLDIVHFGNVELKDGEVVPAMFLQWHYAIPFGVQFDAPENEVATGVFSADYSYYVAIGTNAYRLLTPGIDYSIGNAIPTTATYYRSAIEDTSGKICKYGYNRWSHSAIRQFLNNKGDYGAWWKSQHLGDMAPGNARTVSSLMYGFEEDFLSCLNPIKVTTVLNAITDIGIGMTEDTYDTFFLPSLEQMYAKPERPGIEGDYFEYWKRATGATKPNTVGNISNPGYKIYGLDDTIHPRTVRLRSTGIYTSHSMAGVDYDGNINYYGADSGSRCTPVCAVC